jgi:hypothetical protein
LFQTQEAEAEAEDEESCATDKDEANQAKKAAIELGSKQISEKSISQK